LFDLGIDRLQLTSNHHAIEPQGECADGTDVVKRRKGGMIQASQRRLGRFNDRGYVEDSCENVRKLV
jgi:hypothetical protein